MSSKFGLTSLARKVSKTLDDTSRAIAGSVGLDHETEDEKLARHGVYSSANLIQVGDDFGKTPDEIRVLNYASSVARDGRDVLSFVDGLEDFRNIPKFKLNSNGGIASELLDKLRGKTCQCNAIRNASDSKPACANTRTFDCRRLWDLEKDEIVEHCNIIADHEIVAITHRWKEGEISHKDLVVEKNKNNAPYNRDQPLESVKISPMSPKLSKIREELKGQIKYVWMDTICIDKSSSAETDMSIRSMYRWYKAARFVYLDAYTTLEEWSTRGWTLQEGIAAASLKVSPEHGKSFVELMIKNPNIHVDDLGFNAYITNTNTFGYLYLISKRTTTEIEDMAYCLVGLLEVDFVSQYGEKENALPRLLHQVAIKKGDVSWLLATIRGPIIMDGYYVRFPIVETLSKWKPNKSMVRENSDGIELHLNRLVGARLTGALYMISPRLFPITTLLTLQVDGEKDKLAFYHDPKSSYMFAIGESDEGNYIAYGMQVPDTYNVVNESINVLDINMKRKITISSKNIYKAIVTEKMPLFRRCDVKRDARNGIYTTNCVKKVTKGDDEYVKCVAGTRGCC